MTKIEWDDKYLTGIPIFDKHHKMLFQLLEKANNCMHNKVEDSVIIDDMLQLAITHFREEETAMKKASYPFLEEHKIEHNGIKETLEHLHSDYYRNNNCKCDDLLKILHHWIEYHMMTTDQEYVPWLTKNESTSSIEKTA